MFVIERVRRRIGSRKSEGENASSLNLWVFQEESEKGNLAMHAVVVVNMTTERSQR